LKKHVNIQSAITQIAKELGFNFVPIGHGFPIPDGVLVDFEKRKLYIVEIGTINHEFSEYVGADNVVWLFNVENESEIRAELKRWKNP